MNETWLIIKGVSFDSLLFALLWLYFMVLPKTDRAGLLKADPSSPRLKYGLARWVYGLADGR